MTELQILDAETSVALEDIVAASGLPREEVIELVEYGVFQPMGAGHATRFAAYSIVAARRAARLRADFDLDAAAIALALAYLERIEALERRVRELECLVLRDV
jgi:chaperone modulatory protein CbpM